MLKMIRKKPKKLTDMRNKWQRRRALDNTERLADFSYSDNHIDGVRPEETELEQQKALELQYLHIERYHRFKDILDCAEFYSKNPIKMAEWLLQKRGYHGVNIPNHSRPIPFAIALKTGYEDNIRGMFESEIDLLRKRVNESKKYLFQNPLRN